MQEIVFPMGKIFLPAINLMKNKEIIMKLIIIIISLIKLVINLVRIVIEITLNRSISNNTLMNKVIKLAAIILTRITIIHIILLNMENNTSKGKDSNLT